MASERDRLAYRAWQEELAAEEAAEKERIEAPIRAATEEANRLHRELHSVMRERILNLEDVDEQGVSLVWIDPTYVNLQMPWNMAGPLIADNYQQFCREESLWYWHDPARKNMRQLFNYLERNGVQISSVEMFRRAARRLDSFGIFERRPPEPPKPKREYVNLTVEPTPEPARPATYTGYDLETGLEREYTAREVDAMSSDTYRRVFRVFQRDLMLPNQGPGVLFSAQRPSED